MHKLNPKGIKKIINIVLNVVAVIILIAAAVPLCLQSTRIQNVLSNIIENELTRYFDSKISIGHIDYQLFNTLKINDIYVEDNEKDTLLYVKRSYLDVEFWQLFNSKIIFSAIEFDELSANVKQYKNGKTNADFIINALKQPKRKTPSKLEYRISNFSLKHSNFKYTSFKKKSTTKKGYFNASDMFYSDINIDLDLNILNKDSIDLTVNALNFVEKSGFEIKNIKAHIAGNQSYSNISFDDIALKNSKLKIAKIELNYDSLLLQKNIYDQLRFKIPIEKSKLNLSDLGPLVPELELLNKPLDISAKVSGTLANLRIRGLEIQHEKTLYINTDFEINGLPKIADAFIYTDIKDLSVNKSEIQDIVSKISKKPFVLPKELNNLGLVRYKGNVSGFMNNLVAYGNLKTDIGNISTDILLKFENEFRNFSYNGKLSTNNLKINQLLNSKDLGQMTMNISTKGSKSVGKKLNGDLKGTIQSIELKAYEYKNIELNGKFSGSGFDGSVLLNDSNITADFKGVIDMTNRLPIFNFKLNLADVNLHALNLSKELKGLRFNLSANTNLTGNNANNLNGFLLLNNIQLTNNDKTLNIDNIKLTSRIADNNTNFSIESDFINGSFAGEFMYSKIPNIINGILKKYLPTFANNTKNVAQSSNFINVDLQLVHTDKLTDILELPFELKDTASFKGTVSNIKNKIHLKGEIPYFRFKNFIFEDIHLNIDNNENDLKLATDAMMLLQKGAKAKLYINAGALNDSLSTQLGWVSSDTTVRNSGEINSVTNFQQIKDKVEANLFFKPSTIIFRDSIWSINKSKVAFGSDGSIAINNFKFESNKQFVHVDGLISKKEGDNLQVNMNDIDLGFVMQNILKLKSIKIDGNVTGNVLYTKKEQQPLLLANLNVENASLNDRYIGDAQIKSIWDNENKEIDLSAGFLDKSKAKIAQADGVYVPKNDSLNVLFDLNGFNIGFLQRYFAGVVDNVKGKGYGKIRMLGPTKTLGFEGKALINDAQMTVSVLNTTYTFSDSVKLTRKSIELENLVFYDAERNRGKLSGIVKHNGLFAKMNYNVDIEAKNLIGLDTQAKDNLYFYGKAYTTGTVNISGNDSECDIVVNVATQPKSKGFIQLGGASTASDNSFVRFETTDSTIHKSKTIDKSQFNTKVDLNIDVNSDADMQLIIDPKAGDVIAGRGNGSLQVKFDTFSDLKLYGTYTIESGYYLFTLQSIVRKEFKIDNGSTISWTGDPFTGKIDIRALYPLTASLNSILDESELTSSARRTSIPVNCVLKLTEGLMSPKIKFDIDLPSADESLKQKVRNVINTDEMMNRQIAYLLAFNSFYNPEQISGANSAAFNSFVTSTLSAHLNNFIQKIVKSDLVSLGLDVQQTDVADTQYKAQVMLQPNDRIIVNSNVGYRVDNYTQNPEDKYMFDVDFEYLLTENGKLRFKAYSHTIDRAQLKEAKSTQGMGFAYKEEFQSVKQMFDYYWKAITFKLNELQKTDKKDENKK